MKTSVFLVKVYKLLLTFLLAFTLAAAVILLAPSLSERFNQKGSPARIGDIVVAIVDNEYTVKTLAHDGKAFYLKAANSDYPDIRATNHLEVFGLVTGSFRRF